MIQLCVTLHYVFNDTVAQAILHWMFVTCKVFGNMQWLCNLRCCSSICLSGHRKSITNLRILCGLAKIWILPVFNISQKYSFSPLDWLLFALCVADRNSFSVESNTTCSNYQYSWWLWKQVCCLWCQSTGYWWHVQYCSILQFLTSLWS